MKLSEMPVSTDTLLLSMIVDTLRQLVWMQSEDGVKGRNHPESLAEKLMNKDIESESDLIAFETLADFEEARTKIIGKEG